MIKDYTILSNILNDDEQNILEEYVKSPNLLWDKINNITGEFGGKMYSENLPGRVLMYEKIDIQILNIIEKIQINVCKSLGYDYLKTYRCKINHTEPIDFEYDPLDLIHIDMKMEHLVIVYYINDSDGDTVILENIDGVGMDKMFEHFDGVIKDKFKVIKNIKPQKGTAAVFNGNLYHYGDFPKTNNRFIINIDLAIKDKQQLKKML